jgi:hypothetical protein
VHNASVLARYHELTARIDAFFARVAERHTSDLRCAAGCDACCHTRPTVTAVEAAAIAAWARTRTADERAAIAAAAAHDDLARCPALDDAGRCRIYDARPIICRSHGVPVRMRDARSLPLVTSCHLNFTTHGPAAADADCILDQQLVSTMLALVNQEAGAGATDERIDLADLLQSLATTADD